MHELFLAVACMMRLECSQNIIRILLYEFDLTEHSILLNNAVVSGVWEYIIVWLLDFLNGL